ncbi:MAG: MBL fold metallo-hydrolase [Treponema sp.]|jgi:glyoxylase-like metal-dependent hydrolase (beta-lactamase superfamily II)|nr:MBL fold metallo-hydrolase [Treponema sp.]
MKEYKPQYKVKKLYTDTYMISDNGMGQGTVYMYLLVGTERALLVDSGYGLLDLKAITSSITDKKVICICTHGHLDHALGACQFEEAYLHSKDFDVYQQHSSASFINDMAMKGPLMRPPKFMLNNPSYLRLAQKMSQKQYPPLRKLDGMGKLDIGGRTVSIRQVPGHTQGSVVIIDDKYNRAFDSDAAAFGAWLFLPESSELPEYLAVLKDYQAFLETRGIDSRYAGHSGVSMNKKWLKRLIRCVEISIANPDKGKKIKTLWGDARIVFAGGSLLFCRR